MTDSRMAGQRLAQDHALIVRALTALEYEPLGAIDSAASRMARAPQLVTAMLSFVMAGKPAVDYAGQRPAEVFTELPGGYSVASLVRDFGLSTVGAFLMASELVADTARAQDLLTTMIEEGFFTTTPDGLRALVHPPIAQEYPSCPNCARRSVRAYAACPRCGYGELEAQLDRGEIPDQIIREYLGAAPATLPSPAAPPAARACAACGAALRANQRFCTTCGAGAAQAPPALPTCRSCGSAVKPGVKFCTSCGRPLS